MQRHRNSGLLWLMKDHARIGLVAVAMVALSGSGLGTGLAMAADRAALPIAGEGTVQLAQGDIEPAARPVSYSSDQADRGKDRYERACVECHGGDLKGGMNGGAPLRGVNFQLKYANGAPASALFLFTSTLMPPNSPGRYSPNTYADLMAYILKRNGFRAGAPLPSDVDALDYLIMEK